MTALAPKPEFPTPTGLRNPSFAGAFAAEITRGFQRTLPLVLTAWILVLALAWCGAWSGVRFSDLSRDPLAVAELTREAWWYYGALSNCGIVAWAAGASIAGFMTGLTRNGERGFWCLASVMTAGLLLDDLFQLHDRVLPRLTGIADDVAILGHGLLAVVFLAVHHRRIQHSPYGMAVWAAVWFALSILQDVTAIVSPSAICLDGDYLVEDGAKFVGILLWTAYLVATAYATIHAEIEPHGDAVTAWNAYRGE